MEVFVDDFKQERKDRERCQDENVRFKEQVSQAKRRLRLEVHQNQPRTPR